jgi:hypothetical protein
LRPGAGWEGGQLCIMGAPGPAVRTQPPSPTVVSPLPSPSPTTRTRWPPTAPPHV